ncbi:MAG: tRNA preQ1(34) S-adenosylmethionine ribosyltransferase-isomerase QueA [Fibrobacteria bacterium]
MKTADFDFQFPENLIAYHPLERGESRMMVVDRVIAAAPQGGDAGSGGRTALWSHTRNLIDFLASGDALVLNDTKVLRARLIGENEAGARVEALLLAPAYPDAYPDAHLDAHPDAHSRHPAGGSAPGPIGRSDAPGAASGRTRWEAMVKPGKRFRVGDRAIFSSRLIATVAAVADDGTRVLEFGLTPHAFHEELEVTGKIPLPPYIRREASEADSGSYQSVFAAHPGSVAAPTASLHLSEAMLEAIRAKGVEIRKVTLHVGAGTFKPVQSEDLSGHVMHSERYVMTEETADSLNAVKAKKGRIWAVGTTAARVLETRARGTGSAIFTPGAGETDIFIHPGYAWKGVDGLLTNFHWPKSTLFMLVCSLLGPERAKAAYAEAFAQGFRLFSYGDAMLIRSTEKP